MPSERILEAERVSDKFELDQAGAGQDTDIQTKFKFAGEKQLNSLVEWAKHIPHFAELTIDDQVGGLTFKFNEHKDFRSYCPENYIVASVFMVIKRKFPHRFYC